MFITTLEAFLEPPAMQVVFIYTKKLADIYQLVNSYNFGSIIFGVGDSHTSFIWNKK